MKRKWYLQTWIICILFSFWLLGIAVPPLLLLPALAIVLLVLKAKEDKAIFQRVELADQLESKVQHLESCLTPEMQDALSLQTKLDNLRNDEIALKNDLDFLNHEKERLTSEKEAAIHALDSEYQNKKSALDNDILDRQKKLVVLDDDLMVQDFGLYKPQFDFASALDFKEELAKIRSVQKELIKNKQAVTGNINWTVNGSKAQGKKMVSDTQKLLLRAFNSECDELVSKVKYTNFDASLERIHKSVEAISKLGIVMNISINSKYVDAKVKELRLAFEYQLKKQEEKEQLKLARAEQREQAKAQRELEEQKKKIEKEQTHYQTAFAKITAQLLSDPTNPDLLSKKQQLENQLSDIDKALSDIDYRQANAKAGYVYIISNIGAFGENVYKIGMTRRLDPQERIDELGDASVPFNFDVHAMIFSDNAPALESALHKAFEDKKLNMVNQRREFFNVSLDEIKNVVKANFDKTVEFTDVPDATQYRVSQKLKSIS